MQLLKRPWAVATTVDMIWVTDAILGGAASGIRMLLPHPEQQSALPA
jgi:hypothetical protein